MDMSRAIGAFSMERQSLRRWTSPSRRSTGTAAEWNRSGSNCATATDRATGLRLRPFRSRNPATRHLRTALWSSQQHRPNEIIIHNQIPLKCYKAMQVDGNLPGNPFQVVCAVSGRQQRQRPHIDSVSATWLRTRCTLSPSWGSPAAEILDCEEPPLRGAPAADWPRLPSHRARSTTATVIHHPPSISHRGSPSDLFNNNKINI